MRIIDYVIPEDYDGQKLYNFLRGYIHLSLRAVRTLKRIPGSILLNGEGAKTIDIAHIGDKLTVTLPEDESASTPIDYPLDILYEDEDLLIINKPATLAMHETHNHQGDTLANAVAGYLGKKGKTAAFRAVGRLDKGTSGIVVCALNAHCASRLSGRVKKQYLALSTGKFTEDGTIDKPIYRPDPMKTYRTADNRGDRAVTHYHVEEYGENFSLLRIDLETGRTHQIRVHFAYLGAPLYGDRMYGEAREDITHQALHCESICFTHPITREEISLEAEMPEEMRILLCKLRQGKGKRARVPFGHL